MRVLAEPLPYAQHLLWDLHKKDDVMSKMNKLGMWGKPLEIILSDIFRREIDCKRVSGLTDLQIHAQFDQSEKKIKEWLSLHSLSECFVIYFFKYRVELMRQMMTYELQSMSRLVSQVYTIRTEINA